MVFTAQKQASPEINSAHLSEWENSGIADALTRLNLKSISDQNAIAKLLNWKKYTGTPGWYVQGIDPLTGESRTFGQFKPDLAIKFPGKDKSQKYFSFPKGTDSEAIYTRVNLEIWQRVSERCGVPMPENIVTTEDGEAIGFWKWVLDHPDIPIAFTEGIKKACCLLSQGYVALCLVGVWNGQQKKKKIIPTLEPFTVLGRIVYLVFDADIVVKSEVQEALKVLGSLLLKVGCIVYVVAWDLQLGKGCDDFIAAHGSDEWENTMGDAMPFEQWLEGLEAQFNDADEAKTKKKKIPPADVIGSLITEEYRDRLLWNDEHKTWMKYSLDREGVWSPVSNLYVESAVDTILESKGITGYGSASYVTNIVVKMKRKLFEREWGERSLDLLPFSDGVYDLTIGKFSPHAPAYRLTWCLPRPYTVIASDCSTIDNWLQEATNNNQRNKEVLLCFAAAVLRGRADLQKFLHLIGVGGTGKSTFTCLLEALIGSRNCFIGSLQELSDKHVVADLLGKRLAIFPDQDKVVGSLSNFKRLTGQDALNGRRLYKDGINFRFPGMAVVTSNGPIFQANGGSWLTRRVLMIAFDRRPDKIRDLEKEFESELSAFTNYLLSIPEEQVTRVLRGLGKGDIQKPLWDSQIRTDSIAAWVNEWVIYDTSAKTLIGSDRSEWNDTAYDPNTSTLFGSYSLYCRNTGLQAKGKNNFSSDLIELCQQTLSWQVDYCRGSTGQRMIRGLRLRTPGDTDPTLEDQLTTDNSDNLSDNPTDNLKPLLNKDSDNPDNLRSQNFFPTDPSSFTSHQIALSQTSVIELDDAKTEKVLPQEVVSLPETSINQASQVVSPVVSPVVSELSEIDYESYPHLTCDTIEAKRNQAQKIKRQLLQAKSREELTAIKQEESDRFLWVWRNLLTDAERGKLKAIANTDQLNFLDLAQGESIR
jgi:putative DNA primase/helicase